MKTCAGCGETFTGGRKSRKFCSDNCRKRRWERSVYRSKCLDCGVEISRRSTRCFRCHLDRIEASSAARYAEMERLWAAGLPEAEIGKRVGLSPGSTGPELVRAKLRGFSFPYRRKGWRGTFTSRPGVPPSSSDTHAGANQRLRYAVRVGRVKPPDHCERCGAADDRLDGHHGDYSKPLDVEWLCRDCHVAHHNIETRAAA